MNPTDKEVEALAGAWYDENLVPLAAARRARNAAPYFPWRADPAAASYFAPASTARMTAADFEFPGGGHAAGLVDALVAHWQSEGEHLLARSGPRLHAIAAALGAAAQADSGDVDIFCYTLF